MPSGTPRSKEMASAEAATRSERRAISKVVGSPLKSSRNASAMPRMM